MDRAQLAALARATGCAEERDGALFLREPYSRAIPASQSEIRNPRSAIEAGWLCIRTGGTTGELKFARHDERTLGAAVEGFCAHFGLSQVNAVDVLPPYHVSGWMARVRCAATSGTHLPWDWKRLEAGGWPEVRDGEWVLSLVPTQLQRLMASTAAQTWLRRFKIVFVGGGPLWPQLADDAARCEIPLSPCYGMTETAAMVTALTPRAFLAGGRSSGQPLPHAKVTISEHGIIQVESGSLFRGYWPELRSERVFTTEDFGRLDGEGCLHVAGRRDAAIITGGKKVHPAEVEAILRATGEFEEIVVIGVPDPGWGECVVACYPASQRPPDSARAVEALAAYQRPKRFVAVEKWPQSVQGKVDRAALRRLVVGGD